MANIKSAVKRIKIAARNRKRNLSYKNKVKNLIKQARQAISSKKENIVELVNQAVKWLDKAVSAGVIPKNTSSRKKSRLMKLAAKLKKS